MNDFFSFSSSFFSSKEEEEEDIKVMAKRKALLEEMNFDDHPELSLAPSLSTFTDNTYTSSTESEANSCRKRKMLHASIELHLNHPLPFDWEQCLDLQVIYIFIYIYIDKLYLFLKFINYDDHVCYYSQGECIT